MASRSEVLQLVDETFAGDRRLTYLITILTTTPTPKLVDGDAQLLKLGFTSTSNRARELALLCSGQSRDRAKPLHLWIVCYLGSGRAVWVCDSRTEYLFERLTSSPQHSSGKFLPLVLHKLVDLGVL
jgi:hypothetical protein